MQSRTEARRLRVRYDLDMDLVHELREGLADDPTVCAAWLYGSRARGTATPRSDVDVAVLLRAPPKGLSDMPWSLGDALTARVDLPVQVLVANTAPADLIRRILRDGTLLLDREPALRIRFEVRKRNEYYDMTPVWRQIRRLPPGTDP